MAVAAVVLALGAVGVVSFAGHQPRDAAHAMPAVTTAFAEGEGVAPLRAPVPPRPAPRATVAKSAVAHTRRPSRSCSSASRTR